MSLLAISRHVGSVMGKHLRSSVAVLCAENQSAVQRSSAISGLRCYSNPPHSDSEHVEHTSEPHSNSKSKHKSMKFQKKLHNRVFSDQELAENTEFKSQTFVPETDEDLFGSFQQRAKAKKPSYHSPGLKSTTFHNETFDTLDVRSASKGMHSHTDSKTDFTTETESTMKENTHKAFSQRRRQIKPSQSWSDQFGTLSEDIIADRIEESLGTSVGSHEDRFSDDDDEEESRYIRLSAHNRRRIPEWYGRRILKLGKRGQIREAIEVLEEWMLKQDRVAPNSYVFICLLTVLGRAGYTKKAFAVFRKMKSMGIQPKPAAYTALFNACANSPWKKDGLARADKLASLMVEKGEERTLITGKAMVKAFALCGDLRRAFALVDELSRVYRPDPEMFSFLLMACISDKEAGLRHAIQVWRIMHQLGVQPDRPLYNLLLRCVRDCGVGDLPSFTLILTGGAATSRIHSDSAQYTTRLPAKGNPRHRVVDVKTDHSEELASSSFESEQDLPETEDCYHNSQAHEGDDLYRNSQGGERTQTDTQQDVQNVQSPSSLSVQSSITIPDVLSPGDQNSRIISLQDLSTKENRLLLLGGVEGVLSRMRRDRAKPDVITFTQLLSLATPTVEAEQRVIDRMRSLRVKPDIDLVNALIHKRCMRGDFTAARALGELMVEYKLTANQMTYGVLAMTCKTQSDAEQLLQDMEAVDMAPNMEILGTLMYAAGLKFGYKLWVLRQAQGLDLPPNAKFISNVESCLALLRRKMVHMEKQGETDSHLLSAEFQRSVERFTQHYEAWLKQTSLQPTRHPWASFQSPTSQHKDSAAV